MQHDRVWNLHTFYLKLESTTKKKTLHPCLMYRETLKKTKNWWWKTKSTEQQFLMWNQTTELRPTTTMKMSNFRPEGGTCQIYEGRQHTEPEPGCAASSDMRNRRCEAEQALPGSRERIHLLTESVMKHQLLLEGVTTELTGLQKGIGSTRKSSTWDVIPDNGTFWTRRAVKTHCWRMREDPKRVLPCVYLIPIFPPRGRYCPWPLAES